MRCFNALLFQALVHIPKFRNGAGKILANASTPDFSGALYLAGYKAPYHQLSIITSGAWNLQKSGIHSHLLGLKTGQKITIIIHLFSK
jgi:hypothetical protein